MGLHTSWSKTKIQNVGHGVTPVPVQITRSRRRVHRPLHVYWQWYPLPEILRRISLASNIFGRLANVWKRTGLSLQTKIRLYNTLVISVLLYGSETWTLLKGDERRLEAFHINCQRWFHFVTNACHSPNWRRRLSNPDLSEATHHFWSCVATTGSDTSPLCTMPGYGHLCRR